MAGGFTEAGGQAASRIAKWNGAAWENLTTGVDGAVFAMKFQGTSLYVGGEFTTAGGNTVNGIAKWNTLTSAWESLTTGVSGGASPRVFALEMIDSDLFVGGDFTLKWKERADFEAQEQFESAVAKSGAGYFLK